MGVIGNFADRIMRGYLGPPAEMDPRTVGENERKDSASIRHGGHSRVLRSATRARSVDLSNSHAKDLLSKLQKQDDQIEDHEKQNKKLQKALNEAQRELHEQRRHFDDCEKQNNKLQQELDTTGKELAHTKTVHKHTRSNYNYILIRAIRPYIAFRGIEFSTTDDESITPVLDSLLYDAQKSYALRHEVKQLQNEVQHLQGQGKAQQQQIQILQEKDLELRHARGQLQILQAELLSKVETVTTLPDEHFAKEFRSLVAHVRSLSRSIRTLSTTNITDVLKPCGFLADVPEHHWELRSGRKLYIEAWIWSVLMNEIFSMSLSVFGGSSSLYDWSWKMMFGEDHFGGWPTPSSSCETWRHLTAGRLLDLTGRDVIVQGSPGPKNQEFRATDVINKRECVANILRTGLTTLSAATDLRQTPTIINKAFSLALEMSLSRSRLQVTCPNNGAQFNEREMSVPDANDEEDFDNRTVAFVVRPGLTKWGDAHGRKFEERFDIVPCEVQLEAGGVSYESDLMDLI